MGQTSILIVEDENIVARDLAESLIEMGCTVTGMVGSGEDAIAAVAVRRPDLVLMDIVLKGELDGIAAAEQIHSRFNIPVIFLTAYSQEFLLDRIKVTEPFGFLSKPVDTNALRGCIEIALYKHRIETQLRESEAKYRKLVAALPDGIYVDKIDGPIVFANEAMARMLGEDSPDALMGRRALDMVHPDYREGFAARARRVRDFSESLPFLERKLLRKDGSSISVEIAATPLMLNGERFAQVVVRDITERNRVVEALRKSEVFLNSIIEQSPISIGIVDEHGTAVRQNQACRDLYEVSDDELMGKYNIFKDEVLEAHGLIPDVRRVFEHGESLNVTIDYDFAKVNHCKVARTGTKSIEATLFPVKDDYGNVTNVVIQTRDVGKIRKAESALRASEARFRQLYENSPVMMHSIDPQGIIRNVNRKWLTEFGYEKDEVIGRSIECFTTAESRASLRRALPIFWQKGEVSDLPRRYVKKSGSIVDALVDSVVVDDAVWGKASQTVLRDVTEQNRAEKKLRESEERYRTLFERAGDGILIASVEGDLPGRIVSANHRAAEMHGYSVEEVLSLKFADLDLPEEQSRQQEHWMRMLAGEWLNEEHYHRKKDGTIFPVEISAGLVEIGGERYALCLGRDRTERHQARDLLVRSERLKAVAELATGVAHNFNNMLQIVLGGTHLALAGLERGSLSDVRRNLSEVVESCRLGAETLKRLQEFARMRHDRDLADGKVFDLFHTVDQAIEMSKPWWKANPEREGVKISLHRDISGKCLVKGRESEIFEVVLNLLKNATEALMSQGGEVRVRTFVEGPSAVVQVQDNGVGIPREYLGKIFEPFWTTKGHKGTGMGLASSYGIVVRHGGEVRAESEPGLGALFTVKLPLAAGPQETQVAPVDFPVSFRLSILVVDDMEVTVRQLEVGLKKAGQTVFTALSGAHALEIMEHTPIDLIVCDLGMPGMNGWEFGRSVKSTCRQRGTSKPLLFILTGWSGQGFHEQRIIESGVDLVIEKPVSISELLERIQEVLDAKCN